MAKFLAYGGVRFPTQGSSELLELVKHFESDESFDDLQTQINTWLLFITSPVIINRPSIRKISFHVWSAKKSEDNIYYAQVHYILLGDADDSPNL